ncbi:MAG TPA: MFS transporter, partial [Mycobacterium sp.]
MSSVQLPHTAAPARGHGKSVSWPTLLCWIAVTLDGFDLVVLGAVIPTISKSGALGFTNSSLTVASTIGLIGVGIGAVTIGPLTDR